MVELLSGARAMALGGFMLLSGCEGSVRSIDGDPLGNGGKPSAGGAAPSASGSSAGGTSGVTGRASSAGLAGEAGAAEVEDAAGSAGIGASGASGAAAEDAGGAGAGGGAVFEIGPAEKAACASMCSKFDIADCRTVDQPFGNLGETCQSDCESLFAVQDGACTDLGLEMISCLTQKMPSEDMYCWNSLRDVSLQCSLEVNGYKDCVASVGAGPLPDALCSRGSHIGTGDPTTLTHAHCFESTDCLNGRNYKLDCVDQQGQQSICFCSVFGEGSSQSFPWPNTTIHACKEAFSTCRDLAGAAAP